MTRAGDGSRTRRARPRRSPFAIALATVFAAIPATLVGLVVLGVAYAVATGPDRTPMVTRMEAGPDRGIALIRRHAHLYLAEYDRELAFLEGGREVARAEMAMDSGGGLRVEVLRLDADRLALVDKFGVHVADLAAHTLETRASDAPPAGERLGAFDLVREGEDAGLYRFFPAD